MWEVVNMINKKFTVLLIFIIGGGIVAGSYLSRIGFDATYKIQHGVWQFEPYIDSVRVTYNASTHHCFSDADLRKAGATIVKPGLGGGIKTGFDIDSPITATEIIEITNPLNPAQVIATWPVVENFAPTTLIDIGKAQHVDGQGEPIGWTEPSLPDTIGVGGYTHRYFYYDIPILIHTKAKTFVHPVTPSLNLYRAEATEIELQPYIGLRIQKSIFDNNVSAQILGVDIISVDHALTGAQYIQMNPEEMEDFAEDWPLGSTTPYAGSLDTTGAVTLWTKTDNSTMKDTYFYVTSTLRPGAEVVTSEVFFAFDIIKGVNVYDVQTKYIARAKLAVLIPPVVDPDPTGVDWRRDLFIPLDDDYLNQDFLNWLEETLFQIGIFILIVLGLILAIVIVILISKWRQK